MELKSKPKRFYWIKYFTFSSSFLFLFDERRSALDKIKARIRLFGLWARRIIQFPIGWWPFLFVEIERIWADILGKSFFLGRKNKHWNKLSRSSRFKRLKDWLAKIRNRNLFIRIPQSIVKCLNVRSTMFRCLFFFRYSSDASWFINCCDSNFLSIFLLISQ